MPTTSGSAPKWSALTFQLLSKMNPKTPNFEKRRRACPIRRMKK